MSELRDRLERLAARGTRRGADDVLHAAIASGPVDESERATDTDNGDLEVFDDLPLVMPDPDVRRRGRFGTLVAAVGAAALLGVGALAVSAVFGSGGAGSPEGAVRQLADAISHKDPLAAVDVLVPSEVRSMRETVSAATKRAADLKIVNDAGQPLAGVDLSVDHLQLSSQSLADGFVKVTITSGVISATTHEAAMSKLLQDAQHDSASSNKQGSADLARLASSSDLPTFVIAVRRDGGWYVSPAYTALEYAREIADGPAASFGSAQAANLGADSPEAAVSDALHAWQAGNWDRLMALAPPDELPVYDYRAWIDQEAADTHPDFTIDKLTTSATVNGDTAVVKLNASGTSGHGSDLGNWQVGGTCPVGGGLLGSSVSSSFSEGDGSTGEGTYPSDGSSSGTVGTGSNLCLAGDLGDILPLRLVAIGSGADLSPSGPVSIETIQEDGRWFVSPVTTVLDVVDSTIQHVDQRSIYALLGIAYQLPPDGAITLDQPFPVPVEGGLLGTSVFSFDGTKGQQIAGEVNGSQSYFASGEIYTPDGKDVGYVDFSPAQSGDSYPTELTDTGSYRLVVTGLVPKGATLTLWDAKDAPKSVLGASDGNSHCTRTGNSESCYSSAPSISVCPTTGTTPNVSAACVPPAIEKQIRAAEPSSSSSSSSSSATTPATVSVASTPATVP